MPNDAKLGLVAGVAVVLLIAAVFFRRDSAQAQPSLPDVPSIKGVAPTLPGAPKVSPSDRDLPALPPPPTFSDLPIPGAP